MSESLKIIGYTTTVEKTFRTVVSSRELTTKMARSENIVNNKIGQASKGQRLRNGILATHYLLG